jgi:hypothetical protein
LPIKNHKGNRLKENSEVMVAIEVEKIEMTKEITKTENSIKNLVSSQNIKKNN